MASAPRREAFLAIRFGARRRCPMNDRRGAAHQQFPEFSGKDCRRDAAQGIHFETGAHAHSNQIFWFNEEPQNVPLRRRVAHEPLNSFHRHQPTGMKDKQTARLQPGRMLRGLRIPVVQGARGSPWSRRDSVRNSATGSSCALYQRSPNSR